MGAIDLAEGRRLYEMAKTATDAFFDCASDDSQRAASRARREMDDWCLENLPALLDLAEAAVAESNQHETFRATAVCMCQVCNAVATFKAGKP